MKRTIRALLVASVLACAHRAARDDEVTASMPAADAGAAGGAARPAAGAASPP